MPNGVSVNLILYDTRVNTCVEYIYMHTCIRFDIKHKT